MFRVSIETNLVAMSERVILTTNTHRKKNPYMDTCSAALKCSESLVRTPPLNSTFLPNKQKNLQALSQKRISHVVLKYKSLFSNDWLRHAQSKDGGEKSGRSDCKSVILTDVGQSFVPPSEFYHITSRAT